MKVKKYVIYAKEDFAMVKIKKANLNVIIKSDIIVTELENLEELLIVISIYNTKYLKKIPIVFHNGSTYDYHFLIKQLAEDFKGQFECLGENTENHKTFSLPIKEDDNSKKITYKLKFIDSYRFMPSKLSDLVDNLSEINKKKMSGMHEKKILNQNVNLSDLKIIDYITDAKNIKNMY